MVRRSLLLIIAVVLFLNTSLLSQIIKLNVVTARGKTTVFADTLYAANIKTTVATSNGYFRLHFTSPGFDGAFNIPLNYAGKLGVDGRIQPTFVRKDAHFTGVLTIKRETDKLILLTKSPKDVPEQDSEIYQGIIGDEKREQKFSGELRYQTYTYDEQKFIKRDFIVRIYIELPITLTWNTMKRKWVPESLPTPLEKETEGISITDDVPSDSATVQPDTSVIPVIQPDTSAMPVVQPDTTASEADTGVGSIDTLLEPAKPDTTETE